MAQNQQQIQANGAPAQGSSSARGRFDVANDQSSTLVVRNPSADGSPARSNAQVRSSTVSS